ncbi:MAG TPA: SRPBCC family protein [Candidatus Dormibacteraeota bacterium]|nr:SRPBCC family protein [Candidatus Dormibacteraeota bacterium]
MCLVALVATTAAFGRSKLLRWGATDDEVGEHLPGDDLVADPHLVATRAITIHRPARDVWPWVAQLGHGKAGFYSYDVLENLVGCHIHNANRIVPAWQEIRVGDDVRLAPEVRLDVRIADPSGALVLGGGVPMGNAGPLFDFSWAFALRDAGEGGTRLLIRERYRYLHPWVRLMVEPVEVVSFVMTQKMLRGIRDRAEATGSSPQNAATSP